MSTDIELVSKTLTEFDSVAAGLDLLKKNYGGMLYDVETSIGMEHAKAARAALRDPRYKVERLRKEAKAPLIAIGKKLDSEAARITAEIMRLEDPIDQQIKNEETRKDREKLEKAQAEAKRQADIQARIEAIRSLPNQAIGKSSAEVKLVLDKAIDMVVDSTFAEFEAQAKAALQTTIVSLQGIYAERVNHEAEQKRIEAERIELDRLRAAEQQRQADERARIEAENAKQAEAMRQEREALAAEQARVAAERQALERQLEEARRAAAAAEQQRQMEAEAERLRKEEAERLAKKTKYPGDAAILNALSAHFQVSADVVRGWLLQLRKAA